MDNIINMKLPERLNELRLERGLSQKELAKIINVAPSRISEWENSKKRPVYEDLIALANVFNVTVGYLLGTED